MPKDNLSLDSEVILDQAIAENEEEQTVADELNPNGTQQEQTGQPRPQGNGASQPNQVDVAQGQGQQGVTQNLGDGATAGLGGTTPAGATDGFATGAARVLGGGNTSFTPTSTLGGNSGFGSSPALGSSPSGFSGPSPQDTFNNFVPTVDTLNATNQTEVTGLTNDEFQQVSQDVASRGDVQAREQTDLTQNDFDGTSLTATENTDLTGDSFGVGGAGPDEDNPLDLTGDVEEFLPPVFNDDESVDSFPEDDFIPGGGKDPIVNPPASTATQFIVTDNGIFEDYGYQGSYQEGTDVEVTVDQIDWTADDITVHFEGFADGLTLDLNGFDSGDRIEVDFDKFLQKVSYQWGAGYDFSFNEARYLELEPGWGAAYSKWTLEGDPVSLALTSFNGAAGVKLNVNGEGYTLASTANGANLDFFGNGTSMEQVFLGTNPGDTNGAAFDFIINPHAPRFYIIGEDGKYYLDTDQDNIIDDGDTEVRFPEYLDFSKGQNHILVQGVPNAAELALKGFGRDDRINLDVDALISSLSLKNDTFYVQADLTTADAEIYQVANTNTMPHTSYRTGATKKYGLFDNSDDAYLGIYINARHAKSPSGSEYDKLAFEILHSKGAEILFLWEDNTSVNDAFPTFVNLEHYNDYGNTGNQVVASSIRDSMLATIDFLNFPTEPPKPFYLVASDGKLYADQDQDGVKDVNETEVTTDSLDFSSGAETIRFLQNPDGPRLNISGFGTDDKIQLDVQELISNIGLDQRTVPTLGDLEFRAGSTEFTTTSGGNETYTYTYVSKKYGLYAGPNDSPYISAQAVFERTLYTTGEQNAQLYFIINNKEDSSNGLYWKKSSGADDSFPTFLNLDDLPIGDSGNINTIKSALDDLLSTIDFVNFPSPDITDPTLTSSNPTATITSDGVITLTFSEDVYVATLSSGVSLVASDGSDTRVIEQDMRVVSSNNTLTITPNEDLDSGQTYSLVIADGSLKDYNGNDFAGIAPGDLDFTVAAAPQVSTTEFVVSTNGLIYEHNGEGGYVDINTTYSVNDVNSMFADNAVSIVFSQAPDSKLMLDGFTADDKIIVNMRGFYQGGTSSKANVIYTGANVLDSMTSRSYSPNFGERFAEKFSHQVGTATYKATLALYGGGHLGFNAVRSSGSSNTVRDYKTLASLANVTFLDAGELESSGNQGNDALIDFVTLGNQD